MRGADEQQPILFSYRAIEDRIPADHPLRAMRRLVDPLLAELSPRVATLYATTGRPSIPPEHLLRALLLQVLYTIRSERQLMEQLDYNLLYRWFVGLTPVPSERERPARSAAHPEYREIPLPLSDHHVSPAKRRIARADVPLR